MKKCPLCKECKPLDAFGKQIKRGKVMPRTYCKPCQTEYEKRRMRVYRDANAPAFGEGGGDEREVQAVFLQWRGPVTPGLGVRL